MSQNRRKNRSGNVRNMGNAPSIDAVGGEPFAHASLAVCAFLLAAVFLVFGQTLQHEFINYDDGTYVSENRDLAQGTTSDKIVWAFTTNRASNWHPLTWISHLVDYSLYGLQHPGGHHLTNVLLHAASAMVLFLVLRRLTGDFWPSALAAALFAVHPLRVESVAWVAERKDVLSGLFFMLTLWTYSGYASHRFSIGRYLAVFAFFALGLLAKPSLVTLPFVLLLLDYWPLENGHRGAEIPVGRGHAMLIVEKIPLVLLSAAFCVMTILAQRTALEVGRDISVPWRIGNAAVAYVAYLRQFFWPTDMAIIYPHPGSELPLWQIAVAMLILTAISTVVAILRRRSPYLVTGWLWYLGMLVPMIGLVQVGWQARADRYTYLPQIGVCMMAAWAIRQAAVSRVARRWAFVASAAAVATLMALACRQTAFWHDDMTLWKHTLDCTEENYIADCHLGMALARQGFLDGAIKQYRKAKGEARGIGSDYAAIDNNMAVALSKSGQLDEAISEYEQALALDPKNAQLHVNFSAALQKKGEPDEAISHLEIALKIAPDNPMAHNNLGSALLSQGKLAEAIAHYQKAVELQPAYAEARSNLTGTLLLLQKTPAALVRWREWIDLLPNDYVAMNEAAWLLATSGDASIRNGKDAVELAQRAVRLTDRREPTTLATLAAAYAEAGRYSDAVQTARQALTIALREGKSPLVQSLEAKLPLYESRKPYHAQNP
jgi:protein O-mannosyl-transferase